MRNALLLFLGASLSLPCVNGLTLVQSDSPAAIALDIQRKHVSDPVGRDQLRRKRDQTVSQGLSNEVRFLSETVTQLPFRSSLLTRAHRGLSITVTSLWARPNSGSG